MANNMSDYLENKLMDQLYRGVPFTFPTTFYYGLMSVASTDSTGGTEFTGGSYARVAMACNSTNFANTQASGTGASTGTSGTTSNLIAITYPAPTANWGSAVGLTIFDALTGGNILFYGVLAVAKTINNGDPAPSFAIGQYTYQLDG